MDPQSQSPMPTGQPINQSPDPMPQSPMPSVPIKLKPRRGKKWLWILVVVLILAGGGVAYWMLKKPAKSPTTTNATVKHEIALVRYGTSEGTFNVFRPNNEGDDSVDNNVQSQIFEGLIQYTDRQPKPMLATTWKNPDTSTWVFTIAQGIKFHTGRVMTPDDVKKSLEAYIGKKNFYADTIKTVEVTGTNEVTVKTNSPDPILLNRLFYLPIFDTQSKTPGSPLNGTGPYTVKPGTTPTATEIQLVAFDGYHGDRPLTRALSYQAFDGEDSLVAAVRANKIDIAEDIFDPANLKNLPAGMKVTSLPSLGVSRFRLNSVDTKSPLHNLKVRQAIYAALDPAKLKTAYGVDGEVATQVVPQAIPGFNDAIKRPTYDVAAAKKLLADAGYGGGMTLTYSFFTGLEDFAKEVTAELKVVGITVKTQVFTDPDSFTNGTLTGKFQMYSGSASSSLSDAIDIFSQDYYKNSYYDSASVDTLIDQVNGTFDATKRLQLLQQVSQKLMDDVAMIPIVNRNVNYLMNSSYHFTVDVPTLSLGAYFKDVYTSE